jgi:hypothetical protein
MAAPRFRIKFQGLVCFKTRAMIEFLILIVYFSQALALSPLKMTHAG